MALFRKPKKNIRQRIVVSDEEDDSGNLIAGPPTSSAKVPEIKKKIDSGSRKTSTLSFHEDLEGDEGIETFKIKKSSQSRRIAKQMEKDRKLKEQEQKICSGSIPDEIVAVEEPKIITKSTENVKKDVILTGREAEMAGYQSEPEEESDEEGIKFRQPDPFRHVLESGSIPDAAMIHAARKHRQQARELGGLADYIKVEDTANQETDQVSVTSARLVREDENDKSDEDEGDDGRVDFSVDLQTKDKQKRREAFLAAEQEDEQGLSDDLEDDMDNWERQQFQKAIRQQQLESAHQEMAMQDTLTEKSSTIKSAINSSPARPFNPQAKPISRPDMSKPLPCPSELQAKLRERLTSLEEVNRRHVSDLERFQADLISSYEEIERIESENPKLSERFYFVQFTRSYVKDLIDCLTTKVYEVESLEKRWIALLLRRHRYLAERRRGDINDEAGDCAIQAVIGQSVDPEKISRTAEREARRRRRRLNRKDVAHKEGQSSDEEVCDKESTVYTAEKDKIQQEGEKIFDNTLDEFSSLEAITKRFNDWRLKDREFYQDCHVEKFLPRLSSCVIRSQFLRSMWNPLEHELTHLKKSSWFLTLVQYDLNNTQDAAPSQEANFFAISKTIETVVVPYVNEVVKAAYDPCSISQTNRLVELMKSLMDDHPSLSGSNKVLQSLDKAVVEKFETAVEKDVYIPFHFATQNPVFVNRQFWSAAKLFRNILYWHKLQLIDESTLRANAIDKVFKKNMLLALTKTTVKGSISEPETLDKVSYIAKALPKSWLGPLSPYSTQLQPLIDVTISLAQNADSSTVAGRKQIHGVISVLKSMGAMAEAQEIDVKYL